MCITAHARNYARVIGIFHNCACTKRATCTNEILIDGSRPLVSLRENQDLRCDVDFHN